MSKANKMMCLDCGEEMNHHADKLDYTAGFDDPDAVDPIFGGVVEEAHTCPKCGHSATRKVE